MHQNRQQIATVGIVLARTDFQEADRIITVLTADHGKLKFIAKGVRRSRSKLAGGIELFSVSDLTFAEGRSDIKTLTSSRLQRHYGNIVKDVRRTMFGYDVLKRLNALTEEAVDEEYFRLLNAVLMGLDDLELNIVVLESWLLTRLLQLNGYAINLARDTEDKPLNQEHQYLFDFERMSFREQPGAPFGVNHIKLLRLLARAEDPIKLKQVHGVEHYAESLARLLLSAWKAAH